MREITTRIKFTSPCLGKIRTYRTFCIQGKRKKRAIFFLSKNAEGKVVFLQSWWQANLRKAADVLCRYQRDVRLVQFSPEVDGKPRPIPDETYRRYYDRDRFSLHEAFFAGDVVGVSCLVPSNIDNDGFWKLMDISGKYYGISPYRPGEFGFFKVETVERRGVARVAEPTEIAVST